MSYSKYAAVVPSDHVPRWIWRTVERNSPAHADLEKAWRNTVIQGSLMTAFILFATAGLAAAGLLHSSGLWKACAGVAALALLGLLGLALAVRKNFWLSRAIAVVGTRPDIGYAGFAQLRGIRWITRTFRGMPVLIVGSGVSEILIISGSGASTINAAYDVYLLVLGCSCVLQYLFQASARRELARRLMR
jgi:hypothetical protein